MQNSKSAKPCQDMIYEQQPQSLTQFELCKELYTSSFFAKVQLTPSTKLVLMALANHYPKCFPSQQYIANKMGINVSTVERAIKELKIKGLIIYETKRVNNYKFTKMFFGLLGYNISSGITRAKMTDESPLNDGKSPLKLQDKQTNEQKNNKHIFYKKREIADNNSNIRSFEKRYQRKKQDYRSNCHIEGPQYQEFKPQKFKSQSPMEMSKEQAIEFIEHMPQEIRVKSFFVKQLKQKWNL